MDQIVRDTSLRLPYSLKTFPYAYVRTEQNTMCRSNKQSKKEGRSSGYSFRRHKKVRHIGTVYFVTACDSVSRCKLNELVADDRSDMS